MTRIYQTTEKYQVSKQVYLNKNIFSAAPINVLTSQDYSWSPTDLGFLRPIFHKNLIIWRISQYFLLSAKINKHISQTFVI